MADTETTADNDSRLMHFPITFYAVTMGLFGLTLAFYSAGSALEWISPLGNATLIASLIVFALITVLFIAKSVIYPAALKAEWNHPIRVTFFPAISISLMLIAVCFLPKYAGIANMFWLAGVVLQGILTLSIISRWIGHKPFEYSHINPAWFIPAVGNVVVPIAGAQLGYIEVSWLFLSGGLLFWIVLLTLVLNRMIFHTPIPGKMLPTLVIMIAPPAVAFIAYIQLTAEVDNFARILLNLGYVFFLIVLTQTPGLFKLAFSMSFWALSFPVASLTIGSFHYATLTGSQAHETVGILLLALLTAIIVFLVLRTIIAILKGQVCKPE
ncbi:MAG TPA: C4-dicarboxylate ABC transporter [Rhodobacteraceae bacterium]|jgi:tellurite resistance protein|nr:C4-dicarboxylate ABC transporter [Paracoccaceae bacterium]